MRRMLRLPWGAALAATLAGPAIAAEPGAGPMAYPSGQQPPAALGPGGRRPAGSADRAGPADRPGGAGRGRRGDRPGRRRRSPAPGDGAGSGAFAGGRGAGGGRRRPAAGAVAASPRASAGSPGASGAPPGIIGDFQPISKARLVHAAAASTPVPEPAHARSRRRPSTAATPGIVSANGTTSILFKLTGLKISDNQSPIPQDRFFYSFNYFDNLNASVNQRHRLAGPEPPGLPPALRAGEDVPRRPGVDRLPGPAEHDQPQEHRQRPGPGRVEHRAGRPVDLPEVRPLPDDEGNLISTGLQVTAADRARGRSAATSITATSATPRSSRSSATSSPATGSTSRGSPRSTCRRRRRT